MPDEIQEVRIELTRLVGVVDSLRVAVEAGDKQSEQLVALLKPRLDAQDKNMQDLKEVFRHHETTEHAPHDSTLGVRVGKLENHAARLGGALAVLGIGSPVVAALLTKWLAGS